MIGGVNHLTFSVSNLATSIAFYADTLGFRLVARWPRGAYLLAGTTWIALLLDARTRDGALPEYTHVAFDVAPSDFDAASARIRSSGAKVWQENKSEGASLYFLDPDGHELEIHASDLAARLRAPWDGLEVLVDPATLPGH
jgi:catechol 2,3-dioxygenase-like lactoylglutathione lyase family enzyme